MGGKASLADRLGPWRPGGLKGSMTVLSFDGQWLKLVHLSGGRGAKKVSRLLALPAVNASFEDLIRRLREWCDAERFRPETVILANPSHLTTARLFTLPSSDPKEIKDIVQLQAEKHTPYAREEILTDYKAVETTKQGYTRVMLIVTHKDVVHRALRIVKEMGWPLEKVGYELDGLIHWFQASKHAAAKARHPILLADLHDETVNLVLLHQGRPYFQRTVSLGVNQLTGNTEVSDRFLLEVRRTLEAFEAEGLEAAISELVITGQVANAGELSQRLQESLNLQVHIIPMFDGWKVDHAREEAVEKAPVSFAGLIGLGLAPGEVDLTPPALKLHRTFEVRARTLVTLACQVIALLALFAILMISRLQASTRHYEALAEMERLTSIDAQQMELTLKQLRLIEDWSASRGEVLDLILKLNELAPPDVRWESFVYSKRNQTILRGTSPALPRVFDYVAAVKQASVCSSAEARRVAKKGEGAQSVTEFELVCDFNAPEVSE